MQFGSNRPTLSFFGGSGFTGQLALASSTKPGKGKPNDISTHLPFWCYVSGERRRDKPSCSVAPGGLFEFPSQINPEKKLLVPSLLYNCPWRPGEVNRGKPLLWYAFSLLVLFVTLLFWVLFMIGRSFLQRAIKLAWMLSSCFKCTTTKRQPSIAFHYHY